MAVDLLEHPERPLPTPKDRLGVIAGRRKGESSGGPGRFRKRRR